MLAVTAIAVTACRGGSQPAAAPERRPSAAAAPEGHDNGVSTLPAKEIATRAGRAIHNVAVHVRGTTSDGGLQIATMDVFSGGFDVARCTVSEAGLTIDVLRVGGTDYVRAPSSVWASLGVPTSARADGKFVRAPARSTAFLSFTKFLEVSRSLGDELTATEKATLDGTATINGVPTVAVTAVTPGLSPLPIGTIYVATVGEPYVVRWVSPGDAGSLDFSDYQKPVVVDAPPVDKVIDWDDLTRA
jgi:hypothetical protein